MDSNGLVKIQNNPVSAAIYSKVLELLDSFAVYDVEVKQTSLHVTHGKAFLGVHPRKDGLLLNIVTQSPIQSARLKKAEHVSANRYHNEIEIKSEEELEGDVTGWIKKAYQLAS
jgi:hypothetical protein